MLSLLGMLLIFVLVMLPVVTVTVTVTMPVPMTVRLPVVADSRQPGLGAAVSLVLHRRRMILVLNRRSIQVGHDRLQLLPELILHGFVVLIVFVPDLNNILLWFHTDHDANKIWLRKSFAYTRQHQLLPAFGEVWARVVVLLLKSNNPSSPMRESFPHWHVAFPKHMISSRLMHVIWTAQLRVQVPKLFDSAKAPQIFQMVKIRRCFHDGVRFVLNLLVKPKCPSCL
mmetsp:Transcript_8476/g.28420  ORF Transcript_8476/g.28420 Transcript_8476/m.28420 type:complete len:227 (-) Transcript_8476:364-1044(-)